MEIAKRPHRTIQTRLYWGPCCSTGEQKQVTASLAGLLPGGVGGEQDELLLIWSKGSGGSRGQASRAAVVCSRPAFASNSLVLLWLFRRGC